MWTFQIRIVLFVAYIAVNLHFGESAPSEAALVLNAKCRDLFGCMIRKNCVQLESLQKTFDNATVTEKLYNELDQNIDYGCIFTSGCLEECNRCPLCMTSKQQLVDVLSGNRRDNDGECSVLVNCASECIKRSNNDFNKINHCLRHECAFHCFDGSCPKCSAFVTRMFNQICVSGDFRHRVYNWKGHCYEMFRSIVSSKFEEKFRRTGKTPSIGIKTTKGT
ncbi:protein dct-5 [Ditylenchus destructor]|uniref:Protein dct-5 n=1 Tax=Ditylenchus destructor TaxID=166010 RepID=A0AAD4NGD0_9BILA|nr:protein dct-5 [Ditylenchus destructor]